MHVGQRGDYINQPPSQQTYINRHVHHAQLIASDKIQGLHQGYRLHLILPLPEGTHLAEGDKSSAEGISRTEESDASAIRHQTCQTTQKGVSQQTTCVMVEIWSAVNTIVPQPQRESCDALHFDCWLLLKSYSYIIAENH